MTKNAKMKLSCKLDVTSSQGVTHDCISHFCQILRDQQDLSVQQDLKDQN